MEEQESPHLPGEKTQEEVPAKKRKRAGIHRTAIFTIHNPTRAIRAILDEAFKDYAEAYKAILEYFASYTVQELQAMATAGTRENGEEIRNARKLAQSLFVGRKSPVIDEALAPLESGLRGSLRAQIAETLLSYVELSLGEVQQPTYPQRLEERDFETMRDEALELLRTIADDSKEEGTLRDQLHRLRQPETLPLSFVRIMPDQNCGFFYNPETQRFYARLFVIGSASRHKKKLNIAGRYIDIRHPEHVYMRHDDAKAHTDVLSFGTGERSILVPLEMGRWHEDTFRFTEHAFLPQRNGKATAALPVSAKLIRNGENYQLHVSFEFPKPEHIKAKTLLGVDRGITCLAAGAVLSLDGKEVLETFVADGTELRAIQRNIEDLLKTKQAKGHMTTGDRRRARIADQHVHLCANQIVELALKHQSQVVMEDLSNFSHRTKRPKGQRRSNFNALLPRRQYQKLLDVVDAKLDLVGLPKARLVNPYQTSMTCSMCGSVSKEHRSTEDRTQFHCVDCGHKDHADKQAGVNIARKVFFITLRSKEKQGEVPESKRTTWPEFIGNFCKSLQV